jgi:hypothetical protein
VFFDGQVDDDETPFKAFLDIPHDGELKHASYKVLDDDMTCIHCVGPSARHDHAKYKFHMNRNCPANTPPRTRNIAVNRCVNL